MTILSNERHMSPEPEDISSESKTHLQQDVSHPSDHFVQFYETDAFLLDSLSGFIEVGLTTGEGCIVVATGEHREGLEERLKKKGLDLVAACLQGDYLALDADETLAQFMVDGEPDPQRFSEVISGLIERAAKNGRHVRIFGEMVALLWVRGERKAAVSLEVLWNELHTMASPFLLFCAYATSYFARDEYEELFTEICKQHSHVIPDESYTLLTSPDDRLRAVTLLQQKATSLQAEIAERKEAEKLLRISENRYRRLFETSKDGILMIDPVTGIITDANPFLLDLLGYTRELLVGEPFWSVGLFQDREASLQVLQELQEYHVIRYEELPLHSKNGQIRFVEFVGTLYQSNGHEVIQCNLHDITDRKLAQEAQHYLAAIVESSDDAIFSKDLDGIITSWNAAAERVFGYSAQEIIGQSVTLLFLPDHQDEFKRIMERIYRGERVEHYETTRVHKDGTPLTVAVTVSPIKDNSGTIIGASDITRDITGQKQHVQLHVPGEHGVTIALAAAAVGCTAELPLDEIAAALATLTPVKRRGEIKPGPNGSTLIDDSYNANRQSIIAITRAMRETTAAPQGKRWAILGDIFELGPYGRDEHHAVGTSLAGTVDYLVAIGEQARFYVEGALEAGMPESHAHYFAADVENSAELEEAKHAAADLLLREVRSDDLVLLKGSLGMCMDSLLPMLQCS